MTKKRIIITLLVLAGISICGVVGYLMTRDTVRVTDAVSGEPIHGAHVVVVQPSFGGPDGPSDSTDRDGVARISGTGLPDGGYGIYVSAEGYDTKFIGTGATAENHEGWSGDHMDVTLEPVSE